MRIPNLESSILSLPKSFSHNPPEGYSYEVEQFKRNCIAIWIRNHSKFDYNGGASVRSIWGFYNTKTKQYHSPVSSSKCGDLVEFRRTTSYSAMQIKLTPLELCFS